MYSAYQLQLTLLILLNSKISDLKLKLLRASNTVSPGSITLSAFGRIYILIQQYQNTRYMRGRNQALKVLES